MADKAISELVRAGSVKPGDLFAIEQDGTAKSVSGQTFVNWLTAYADGHGGIQSVQKTATHGLVDTYTMTLADTTKVTWTVTNGAKGDKGDNAYVHIKYASRDPSAPPHSMGDIPDKWLGIYAGPEAAPPDLWSEYKWYEIKGEKGDTGLRAELRFSKTEYQASTSGTAIPIGQWLPAPPAVAKGSYLWTRVTNTYNSGDPVVAYTVGYMGIDGRGTANSAAGVPAGPDGDIPLTIEHLGGISLEDFKNSAKKIVVFSDSYGVGATGSGGTVENYLAIARQNLGMDQEHFVVDAKRGAGFAGTGGTAEQYITRVRAVVSSLGPDECAAVSNVIVAGGPNDVAALHRTGEAYHKSLGQIIADRDACIAEIRASFPHARVTTAFVGRFADPDYLDDWLTIYGVYANVGGLACRYMSGIEEALHDPQLISSDGVHPTAEGYRELGAYFAQGILQGRCDVCRSDAVGISASAVRGLAVEQVEAGGTITMTVDANDSLTPTIGTHRCAVDTIVLCKMARSYVNGPADPKWSKWPCTALVMADGGRVLCPGELSIGHTGLTQTELRLKLFALSGGSWATLKNVTTISLKAGPLMIDARRC